MTDETVSAATTISASPESVFAVLADPAHHAEIDGTGWVRGTVDGTAITHPGQVFRVAMHHPEHPDGDYEISNLVLEFDPPHTVSWRPVYVSPDSGDLEFGGWIWRYDLTALGSGRTRVIHTYDWSEVGPGPREYLEFPPFPSDHLDNSLAHLAAIVTR